MNARGICGDHAETAIPAEEKKYGSVAPVERRGGK
jgi:hypothetical protein